ncbi:hypothetical protein GCM10009107_54330 [Ideonella azotifigens]|uniref:Uncharacterized protein n=1 Tax=Ideonella azotifigens TaxID=513160 RepID=A0ABN1KH64_9BURK
MVVSLALVTRLPSPPMALRSAFNRLLQACAGLRGAGFAAVAARAWMDAKTRQPNSKVDAVLRRTGKGRVMV